MIIENQFSTPIWIEENVNFHLEDFCLVLEQSEDSQRFTNVGGFQSRKDIHKQPEVKNLIEWCENQFKLKALNSWVNVNKKGDYNRKHLHPRARVSCVYYVKGGSNIRFYDPRHVMYMTDNPLVIDYEPKDNMIICFPAWLEHEVMPNESDEPRISIAVNLG